MKQFGISKVVQMSWTIMLALLQPSQDSIFSCQMVPLHTPERNLWVWWEVRHAVCFVLLKLFMDVSEFQCVPLPNV